MIQRNPTGTRRTFAVNLHDGRRLLSYGIIVEYAMVTTAFNLLETAGVETRQAEAIVSEMRWLAPVISAARSIVPSGFRALASSPTALRFLPTLEYGFSLGKRDIAAEERERQLTLTLPRFPRRQTPPAR